MAGGGYTRRSLNKDRSGTRQDAFGDPNSEIRSRYCQGEPPHARKRVLTQPLCSTVTSAQRLDGSHVRTFSSWSRRVDTRATVVSPT
jgi:hypothetical protein